MCELENVVGKAFYSPVCLDAFWQNNESAEGAWRLVFPVHGVPVHSSFGRRRKLLRMAIPWCDLYSYSVQKKFEDERSVKEDETVMYVFTLSVNVSLESGC